MSDVPSSLLVGRSLEKVSYLEIIPNELFEIVLKVQNYKITKKP